MSRAGFGDLPASCADPATAAIAVVPVPYDRTSTWKKGADRGPDATRVLAEVRRALADDLDAPRALGVIDAWAESVALGEGDDPDAPRQVAAVALALLGVRLRND